MTVSFPPYSPNVVGGTAAYVAGTASINSSQVTLSWTTNLAFGLSAGINPAKTGTVTINGDVVDILSVVSVAVSGDGDSEVMVLTVDGNAEYGNPVVINVQAGFFTDSVGTQYGSIVDAVVVNNTPSPSIIVGLRGRGRGSV